MRGVGAERGGGAGAAPAGQAVSRWRGMGAGGVLVLAALLVCVAAAPARSQEAQRGWRFALTPYLWAASLAGETTLPRQTRDFDADFGDLLADLELALMGTFEARYAGRLSLVLDAMTLSTEQGFATPRNLAFAGGRSELTATQLSALGLLRVWQEPGFGLDLGAGMRAWWVENKVTLNPGLAAGRSASVSADFNDPILALRAEFRLAERWSALAYADIGGFDTASRLTWQVVGAVGWQATENVSVQAGYRHLAVDRARADLALDLAFGGPMIGVTFRF